jgi:hypothetical protein
MIKSSWAIYDFFLGNPVFVGRCDTKGAALRIAEQRSQRSCTAVHVVEQLVPHSSRTSEGNRSTQEPAPATGALFGGQ